MKKNTASTLKKTGKRKGFSLVELLVAMSLSGIIVSAVYGLFIHQNKSLIVQGQVTENQQNIRSAMEIMGMDLKMAGFGFSIAGTASYYNGTGISTLKAVAATNNSTSSDSIQISYGDWSVKAKLTSPMTTHSSPLLVNSTSGFLANDIIIITDGTNASLLQITGINSGELVHGSSPLNPPFGFSFFPRAYAVGSSVYKLKQVCYRINNSDPNHPCLEVDLTGPFLGASFRPWPQIWRTFR